MLLKDKHFKLIGIIIAFVIIAMFCILGYKMSYKKDLEKIDSPAVYSKSN